MIFIFLHADYNKVSIIFENNVYNLLSYSFNLLLKNEKIMRQLS